MKTLYLDCSMGASGDMLAGALWGLVKDKEKILSKIEAMGLPGVSVEFAPSEKCGIKCTKFNVLVHGQQEHSQSDSVEDIDPLKSIGDFVRSFNVESTIKTIGKTVDDILGGLNVEKTDQTGDNKDNNDPFVPLWRRYDEANNNKNEEEHTHEHHNSYMSIKDAISNLNLSDRVKADVAEVYRIIAEAESKVHGVDMEHIHFHELGTLDALADIAVVCMLLEQINPDRIIASNVNVGGGFVKCAHGTMPVPAPATANILKNIPIYQGKIKSELCTPTGAALLKHFVESFGDMPSLTICEIGYGCGEKNFEIANCLRALLAEENLEQEKEKLCELSCNIDDMSAERIGFAMEMLLNAGAVDVYTQAIGMKKNRPATMLTALCTAQTKHSVIEAMFKHTTTLGIRERELLRHTLHREITEIDSRYGKLHKKTASGYGVNRSKYEYEDLARIARENNMSIEEVEKSLQ